MVTFLEEDNEFRSYFLGLIMADGSMPANGCVIDLVDEDIIVKIRNYVNPEINIGVYKSSRSKNGYKSKAYAYRISFLGAYYSKCFTDLGFSLGVKKTGREFIPKCIDQVQIRHFIRGLSDGDGCFTLIKNRNTTQLEWNITCANKKFLQDILDFLVNNSIVSAHGHSVRDRYGKNCYRITFGHHDAVRLGEYLYSGETISLHRKKEKWLSGKKIVTKRPPKWTKHEIAQIKSGENPAGRSKSAISAKKSLIKSTSTNQ